MIAGQSFAEFLATDPTAVAALAGAFSRRGVTFIPSYFVRGGSSALKANAPPSNPTWYWWDETTNSAGPLLTQAIAYINAIPAGSKPTRLFWLQGEADSVGPNPDPVAFKAATIAIIAALRAALGTNPGVLMAPVGRRMHSGSGQIAGVQIIREAQLDLIAAGTFVFALDIYPMKLLGDDPAGNGASVNDSHPIVPDRADMGWRIAQRALQSILISDTRQAPLVSTIYRNGNDVVIPMATWTNYGDLIKPAAPSHLAIRDAGGVIESPALSFAWSGNELVITPPRAFADGHFLAPYGDLNVIDRDNLIRESAYGMALRTTKAAIPA